MANFDHKTLKNQIAKENNMLNLNFIRPLEKAYAFSICYLK